MQLRPYQDAATAAVYQHLAERDDHPCVVIPTGGGKGVIVGKICDDVVTRWNGRILVLTHVKELVDQNATQAGRFLSPLLVGVHSAGLKRRDIDHPVIIAGIQSVYQKACDLGRFDIVLIDECFPAGTQVDTPTGRKPIEDVLPGDDVMCATGVGRVMATSARSVTDLVSVEFSDESRITCTPNHTIFTERGWIPAGSLAIGALVFGREDLRRLWQGVPAVGAHQAGWRHQRDEGEALEQAAVLLDLLLEEASESHAVGRRKEGHACSVEGAALGTDSSWWKWTLAAAAAAGLAPCAGAGLGAGVDRANIDGQGLGLPDELQGRYRPSDGADSDRGGRGLSPSGGAAERGPSQEPLLGGKRVASVARVQPAGARLVFNLQVDRHPSYFADGVLVHNCHLIPPEGEGMYQTFLRDARVVNPRLRLVGLTATPFRLKDGPICAPGNLLNHVCYEVGVKELIRDGFLSPLVSKAGKAKADTTGLHVRGGEFIPDEVEHLMDDDGLVRAACAEIAEQTRSRKACLVFAAGVQHAEHVATTLASATGAEVACIFGHTPDGERDRMVARFKQGALRYLVNVGVLTTGFDAPQVDCVALLRPTMSPGLYYQMVGRGFRLAPGKDDCLVLDFGGNVLRHGPVDALTLATQDDRGTGEAPAKECPQCQAVIAAGFAACPQCGFVFPPPEREKHEREASSAGVLSGQVTTTEYAVRDILYAVHQKRGAPPEAPKSLRVEYEVGLNEFHKEWVCFEHVGFARGKAEAWWRARSRLPVPSSAAEACRLACAGALATASHITVRTVSGEDFERITDHRLGPAPEPREPGDDREEPAFAMAGASAAYDDEPPF
jgi:DNA repair protein RadD